MVFGNLAPVGTGAAQDQFVFYQGLEAQVEGGAGHPGPGAPPRAESPRPDVFGIEQSAAFQVVSQVFLFVLTELEFSLVTGQIKQ